MQHYEHSVYVEPVELAPVPDDVDVIDAHGQLIGILSEGINRRPSVLPPDIGRMFDFCDEQTSY